MTQAPIHINLEFPPAFLEFTRQCEAYCVAGCCGLDAFSFDDETLGAAIDRLGAAKARDAYESGIEFATSYRPEKTEFWSAQDDFNHIWASGESFYNWMKDIVASIEKQIQIRSELDGGGQPATSPESK